MCRIFISQIIMYVYDFSYFIEILIEFIYKNFNNNKKKYVSC